MFDKKELLFLFLFFSEEYLKVNSKEFSSLDLKILLCFYLAKASIAYPDLKLLLKVNDTKLTKSLQSLSNANYLIDSYKHVKAENKVYHATEKGKKKILIALSELDKAKEVLTLQIKNLPFY